MLYFPSIWSGYNGIYISYLNGFECYILMDYPNWLMNDVEDSCKVIENSDLQ